MTDWIVPALAIYAGFRITLDLVHWKIRHDNRVDLERQRQLWRINSEEAAWSRKRAQPAKKAG